MKKTLKKAFTLVELLVVIAIVAVLTVAGVVTYSAFTKKAELSNDISAVTQFDDVLRDLEALNGKKVTSLSEAVEALKELDIDVANFKLASEKHKLGFDMEKCQFVLVEDGKIIFPEEYEGAAFSGENMVLVEKTSLPVNSSNAADLQTELQKTLGDGSHAHYISEELAKKVSQSGNGLLNVSSSVDAKYYSGKLNYSDTEEETVTFNSGYYDGNPYLMELQSENYLAGLQINNPNATVNQYGYVGAVEIHDVKEYHCFATLWEGKTGNCLTIDGNGTIVLEDGAVNQYYRTGDRRTPERKSMDTIISVKADGTETHDVTIELKSPVETNLHGNAIKVVINLVPNECKNVNLTIKSNGGNIVLRGYQANSADRSITDSIYTGYVDNDGVFHENETAESWASKQATMASAIRFMSVEADDDVVATSTYKYESGEGTWNYTAKEFAGTDGMRYNPLWLGNCKPNGLTTITLQKDATLDVAVTMGFSHMEGDFEVVFELNSHTLTFANNGMYHVYPDPSTDSKITLTVQNGTIISQNTYDSFVVYASSTALLDKINYTGACPIYIQGLFSTAGISNSIIESSVYGVATNASTATDSSNEDGVLITISNSKVLTPTGTAVLLNVPGQLEITNCDEIRGGAQAVFARAGKVTITNSDLYLAADSNPDDQTPSTYFDNRTWGQGNVANLAPLTIGNKSTSAAYQRPVEVILNGCRFHTLTVGDDVFPAIYVWSNNTEGNGVTLTYDTACQFNGGKIVLGGTPVAALGEDNYGLFNLTVNSTSYAGQQGPIIIDPNASQE